MSTNKVLKLDKEFWKSKTIVIVGVGGLGCHVAQLLARLGANLVLIDNDIVDDTNLERQILFDKEDLLKNKAVAARKKLIQFSNILAYDKELTKHNMDIIKSSNANIVIDCTDNVETRLLINEYCLRNNIPWIYSGAVYNIGTIYLVLRDNRGCYNCLNQEKHGETSCDIGVLNSIVATVGAWSVNIAVNYLAHGIVEEKLIRINFKDNSLMKLDVKKNPKCSLCKVIEDGTN